MKQFMGWVSGHLVPILATALAVAVLTIGFLLMRDGGDSGSAQRMHEERVACYQGGGEWNEYLGCRQPNGGGLLSENP